MRLLVRSELLLAKPHAFQPGVGLLQAPAVMALEHIGYGDHQVKGTVVVAASGDGCPLQSIGELEKLQFSEPVTLLKGSKGVVLLIRKAAELGRAAGLPLEE